MLLVTINPEFRLYLDEQGNVLAVEPVNDDAKEIAANIKNTKGDLETVIHDIISVADEEGFVKENATVNFQITMVNSNTINTDNILNIAKEATDKVFVDSNKTIEVSVSVAEDALKEETASQEEATSSNESTSAPVNSTTSTNTQNTTSQTHQHSFSAATCTTPKKCSCGATEGNALGHKYSNGTCTVCGDKDPNFVSYTSVKTKTGNWNTQFLVGKTLYNIGLTLYPNEYGLSAGYSIGDLFDDLPLDMQTDINNNYQNYADSIYTFEGNKYYVGRGSGDDITAINEDGTTITLTDTQNRKLVLTRTGENTMTVKSCDDSFGYIDKGAEYPVGSVFTFKAN